MKISTLVPDGAYHKPLPSPGEDTGVFPCKLLYQMDMIILYRFCLRLVRFRAHVEKLPTAFGHANRVELFQPVCKRLSLSAERKSVEPMAGQLASGQVSAKHQSVHHFVAKASWSDDAVMRAVRDYVQAKMQSQGHPGSFL